MNQNSGSLNQNLNQDSNSKINESEQLIEKENSNEQQVQKSWQEKFRELELLNFDQQRQIDLLKNSLRDSNELLSQKNQIIENYQIFEQLVGIEKTQQQRVFQDLNNSILQLKQDKTDLEDYRQGCMQGSMQGGMQGWMQGHRWEGMPGSLPVGIQGNFVEGMYGSMKNLFGGMPVMHSMPSMPSMSFQTPGGMPFPPMATIQKKSDRISRQEIEDLNEKINELETLLEKERNKQKRALQNLNNENTSLELEKSELDNQVNLLNYDLRKLKRTLNDKNDREQELMSQLKQLQDEYDELQQKQQTLINAAMRNIGSFIKQGSDPMINLSIFLEETQNQTNKLNNEIKDEASKYKKEIQELIEEKQKMQEEFDEEHRNYLSATDEVVNINKLITQLIKDFEDSQENYLRALRQKNNELSEKQLALDDLKYQNQQLELQIDQLQKTEEKLREFLNNKNKVSESQLENELKKFQDQQDNILRQKELELEYQRAKTDQEKEKLRKKMEDEKIAFENKQKMLVQEEGKQNKIG